MRGKPFRMRQVCACLTVETVAGGEGLFPHAVARQICHNEDKVYFVEALIKADSRFLKSSFNEQPS